MTRKSIATASIKREADAALIDVTLAVAQEIGTPAGAVNATGNLRAFETTDDAPFLAVDVAAIDKAWSAASYRLTIHGWNDCASSDPEVTQLACRQPIAAVGNDYPILEDGRLIAGIRISGGKYQEDQGCLRGDFDDAGFRSAALTGRLVATSRRPMRAEQ